MFARKANKIYRVDDASKAGYLAQGYDIVDDEGDVIEHSPQATVKYSDYEKLLNENKALKEQVEKYSDYEKLLNENKALKEQVEKSGKTSKKDSEKEA